MEKGTRIYSVVVKDCRKCPNVHYSKRDGWAADSKGTWVCLLSNCPVASADGDYKRFPTWCSLPIGA